MSMLPTARWGLSALTTIGTMTLFGGLDSSGYLSDTWQMTSGCSGVATLTGSRGVFSDGDGPYRNSLDCKWTISPSLPNSNVLLVLTQLELLDDGDKLEIYDGSSTSAPLLASYTGTSIPPSVTSTGRHMVVWLRTDAAGAVGDGFQAAYQAVCNAGYTWDTVRRYPA